MSSYSPDLNNTEVSPEPAGQEAEHEIIRTLSGPGGQAAASGADPAGAGNPGAALHTVTTGIRSGIPPLQFMDSIDAGGRHLGNRSFMHWVRQLHGEGQAGATHEIAARGLQGPGRPLTHLDTLQRAFGHHDIRGMREHTGAVAGSALDALDAAGYTRGGRMALAGAPDLYTQAHEAAHGVQQAALGGRMALPGGIGVAGDGYEQQADAVAQAVLRGASAQPLLDRMVSGPVQVHAGPVGAAAPVQMRRRRRDSRARDDEAGTGSSDTEEEGLVMTDVAEEQDIASAAGSGMELLPFTGAPDQGQFITNPIFQPLDEADTEIGQAIAELEQATRQWGNTVEQQGVPQPDGGGTDSQQSEATPEQAAGSPANLAEQTDVQPPAGGGVIAGIVKYLFPGAQPTGENDDRGTRERYLAYFFPAVTYLYACLKDRAGQVQTDAHGACSLRGILNMLATVMFGVMMVAPGLPLDAINNLLGGIARVIVMLSTLLGLPADWLLKLHQKKYPPSEEDRARVEAEDALIFPPRHIPEWLITLGFSGYFQAALSQGSISPSQWLQPWSPLRISVIVGRSIADLLFINILFGGLARWIGKNILMKKLEWGPTRAQVYLLSLAAIQAPVIDYVSSYLLNPELSVFLTWQNIHDRYTDLSAEETTAAFIGFAALGMFLQYLVGILLVYFLLARIGAGNDKWRKQFYAISNKLLRYIAIFLASGRNMIINILSLSNFAALVATNIIGPLAREFGQGGACIWPLAAAGVCGELPGGFNFYEFGTSIEHGESALPSGHLDIIRAFPGVMGVLGLGIPIATVIALLCRKRWARRAAAEPDQRGRRAARRGLPRRTRHGTPVPDRRGRRAPGRDRFRLAEEGDDREGSPHDQDTIRSLPGTTRSAGSRSLPSPGALSEIDATVPEDLTPIAQYLCRRAVQEPDPISYLGRQAVQAVDRDWITYDEFLGMMDWGNQYLLPANAALGPEQSASVVMTAQHSSGSSVTTSAGSSTSATSASDVASAIDPQVASTADNAMPKELTPNAAILCSSLINSRGLTMDSADLLLHYNVAYGHISQQEAGLIRGWLRQYMFSRASSPRHGQMQAAVTGAVPVPSPSVSPHFGAAPVTVDGWIDYFVMVEHLTLAGMHRQLDTLVADRRLTAAEAATIADTVQGLRLFE